MWPGTVIQSLTTLTAVGFATVVEDLVKQYGGKEMKGGFCWIRWVLRRKEWQWKEIDGGGAHQGQSGWSKTTGATDL
ncbi:hypothetical protein BY996DRAFT_6593603 [Phakopsora pachyrhizi]|nr:hypothetical protein BY996DRAFT_6593603 [Phakopsora pachyrhizi]